MQHVIKRRGHTEPYDERKLYGSIFYACQAVRVPAAESELVAEKVCKDVGEWLKPKHTVTSRDVYREAQKNLNVYNQDAGWMYQHQRNVS